MHKNIQTSETLFSDDLSLTIVNKQEHQLSKSQKSFNRLIKKIEKLQKELTENARQLDLLLQYYSKVIHPLENLLSKNLQEFIIIFYDFYKSERNKDRKDVRTNIFYTVATQLTTKMIFFFCKQYVEEL